MSTRAPKKPAADNSDTAAKAAQAELVDAADAGEAPEPDQPPRPSRARPAAAAVTRDLNLVTIPLAHFVRIDGKEHQPRDMVTVTREQARSLISQGAVAVNPADHRAVAKLLGG